MSFQLHTLHNKMEWWRRKIGLSLKPQGPYLMSTRPRINFGPKTSTPRAMQSVAEPTILHWLKSDLPSFEVIRQFSLFK